MSENRETNKRVGEAEEEEEEKYIFFLSTEALSARHVQTRGGDGSPPLCPPCLLWWYREFA